MNFLKNIILLLLLIQAINCSDKKNNINTVSQQTIDTLSTGFENIRSIAETLSPESKEKIASWPEYQQLDDFLTSFYTVTPKEALNMSKELASRTTQLKDSLKIEAFKSPDVLIRIDVLNNYALRLDDMATIQAIENTEVNEEIQHILDAFSSLNAKINNLVQQEELQTELNNFEQNLPSTKGEKNVNKQKPASLRN